MLSTVLGASHALPYLILMTISEVETVIIPVSLLRKLRLRDME